MSDLSTKKIPTLVDVITGNDEETTDTENSTGEATSDDPDLFVNNTAATDAEDQSGPDTAFPAAAGDEADTEGAEAVGDVFAFDDEAGDIPDVLAVNVEDEERTDTTEPVSDELNTEDGNYTTVETPAVETVQLDQLVDDIINQLMPNLEQLLRVSNKPGFSLFTIS